MRASTSVEPVDGERLAEDLVDGLARVQRAVGVLEHHLHSLRCAVARRRSDPRPATRDLAGPVRDQPGDGAQHGGLARAGFADQAERLALGDVEA